MTIRQSETLLRALVALSLGIGFVGFATHARGAQHAHTTVSPEATTLQVAATPTADGSAHAGI